MPIPRFAVFSMLLACSAIGEETVRADCPPDFVPLGAYLSWERPAACAKSLGIDVWVDVSRRLDAIEANHVNLLWVTNMSETDLPRLISECEKRKILLLPSMGTVEARVDWRWEPGSSYYEQTLPPLVKLAGDSKTLVGWVLSDEPQEKDFPRLETLRQRLRELDPNRFCTSVLMWPQAPLVLQQAKLPVVCVDLYPFFGPGDPNGPHTDDASKSFFRRNARTMLDSLDGHTAVGWIMGMCFSDIWGPRRFDSQGHLIGLPGSYLHWRCPTLAEMRWQVWESIRSGAKGVVSYTLAPEAPDPQTASLPAADVEWKDVLAKTDTDLGPNALTNPDGSVTPQLEELGRAYAAIEPHTPLIRRWQRQNSSAIETSDNGQLQTFKDPETNNLYAVLLNDDLQQARDIPIRAGEGVSTVADVVRAREIPLEKDFAGGSSTGHIPLAPGEGTVLLIKMAAH